MLLLPELRSQELTARGLLVLLDNLLWILNFVNILIISKLAIAVRVFGRLWKRCSGVSSLLACVGTIQSKAFFI